MGKNSEMDGKGGGDDDNSNNRNNRGYNHRGEKHLLKGLNPQPRKPKKEDDEEKDTGDNDDHANGTTPSHRQDRADRERRSRESESIAPSSPLSIARPGAHRMPGINGIESSRTLSSVSTVSEGSSTQQQAKDSDVTLVATALDIVEERDLAEQYCRERLQEIEEREKRLREREANIAATSATNDNPSTTTVSVPDAATIITATVVDPVIDATSMTAASPPQANIVATNDSMTKTTIPGKATLVPQNAKPEKKHHRKTSSGGVFARVFTGPFRRGDSLKGDALSGVKKPIAGYGRATSTSSSTTSSTTTSKPAASTIVSNFTEPAMNGWTWCWKETPARMARHDPALVVGDPDDCWIRYHFAVNRTLETAFLAQDRKGSCVLPEPLAGYEVDFEAMQQTKLANGYQREVKREFLVPPKPEDDKKKKASSKKSSGKKNKVTDKGAVWSWRETPSQMKRHDPTEIESEAKHLIRYSDEASRILEQAFQSDQSECRPIPGYRVDLTIAGREEQSAAGKNGKVQTTEYLSFVQTKDATAYQRDVIRRCVKES